MVRRQAFTSRMPSIGVLTIAVVNRLQHGQHIGRPRLLALQDALRAERHVGRVPRRLEGLDHLHVDPWLLRRVSHHCPYQRSVGKEVVSWPLRLRLLHFGYLDERQPGRCWRQS